MTPFLVAFGAWAVAQIGIMIPITPGGLGTVDAFMISLLTAMGVSAGDATAADLVWRAASFVPQIIIGIIAAGHVEQARRADLRGRLARTRRLTSTATDSAGPVAQRIAAR